MSTYELDDDEVRAYLAEDAPVRSNAEARIVSALSAQLPIPVPTNIGAVVRTHVPVRGPGIYLRWAYDEQTLSPWIQGGDVTQWYRTDEIGRITEVLSEGVDL